MVTSLRCDQQRAKRCKLLAIVFITVLSSLREVRSKLLTNLIIPFVKRRFPFHEGMLQSGFDSLGARGVKQADISPSGHFPNRSDSVLARVEAAERRLN